MATQSAPWALAALLALLPLASAHICIKKPEPFTYSQHTSDRSPLAAGEYPCKFHNYSSETRTTIAVNEPQMLEFFPTTDAELSSALVQPGNAAVHDGGSCQLSITLDTQPTADSVFKVFYSVEGGCPGVNGRTSDLEYTLPLSIPNGDAVFAWTWFPVSSGVPEMYMNCAPITVTGGADADDYAEFDKLPDIFVANIPERECYVEASAGVLEFPDPGLLFYNTSDVVASTKLIQPYGAGCGTTGSTTSTTPGQPQATNAESTPTGGDNGAPDSSSSTTIPAVNFAEDTVPETSSTKSVPTRTALGTPDISVTRTALGTTATGTPGGVSECESGQLVCNGTTQFGLCNWGTVAVWEAVADGTECVNGAVREKAQAVEYRKRGAHLRNVHVRRSLRWW